MASPSPKNRLGEFFRSHLDDQTEAELHFFNNNADQDSLPPYGVVVVTSMEETTPLSNVYRGKVEVRIISSIDMPSNQHDQLVEDVILALNRIPRRIVDEINNIRMFGWTMTKSEPTQNDNESQSWSDVITILAGCSG
jgi:hypothetical protein